MSGTGHRVICRSLADTAALAARIARAARSGDAILLRGALGAGKTAFARGFIQALLPGVGEVPSPTFTLLQIYPLEKADIWHLDLYRIQDQASALELGIEEAFQHAITLIEWPEIIDNLLPEERLNIAFAYGRQPEERRLTLTGTARLLDAAGA